MPLWMLLRLQVVVGLGRVVDAVRHRWRLGGALRRDRWRPGGTPPGRAEAGFSTAEGLAGAALAVVALIAIWAAMRAFGLDIIRWMQDQITSQR